MAYLIICIPPLYAALYLLCFRRLPRHLGAVLAWFLIPAAAVSLCVLWPEYAEGGWEAVLRLSDDATFCRAWAAACFLPPALLWLPALLLRPRFAEAESRLLPPLPKTLRLALDVLALMVLAAYAVLLGYGEDRRNCAELLPWIGPDFVLKERAQIVGSDGSPMTVWHVAAADAYSGAEMQLPALFGAEEQPYSEQDGRLESRFAPSYPWVDALQSFAAPQPLCLTAEGRSVFPAVLPRLLCGRGEALICLEQAEHASQTLPAMYAAPSPLSVWGADCRTAAWRAAMPCGAPLAAAAFCLLLFRAAPRRPGQLALWLWSALAAAGGIALCCLSGMDAVLLPLVTAVPGALLLLVLCRAAESLWAHLSSGPA